MSNWLEEAENSNILVDEHGSLEEKLELKKKAIQQNYLANQSRFDEFNVKLKELVKRVNDLPAEYREPFGKISFCSKETKLDNHLYYISSSMRIKKRLYRNVSRFFKKHTFKKIRVAYFTVSRQQGMIDIELKENLMLRMRMTRTGENEQLKYKGKKSKDRKDYLFRLDLNRLEGKEAMEIIDWLVFKNEMEDISFFNEQRQLISP